MERGAERPRLLRSCDSDWSHRIVGGTHMKDIVKTVMANSQRRMIDELRENVATACVKEREARDSVLAWERRFDRLLVVLEKLAEAAVKGKLPASILLLTPHLLVAGVAALALCADRMA
jgi:hypothetical protein